MINSYPISTFCIFAVADGIDSFVDIHETSIELNKEIWWPYVVPNTDIKKNLRNYVYQNDGQNFHLSCQFKRLVDWLKFLFTS